MRKSIVLLCFMLSASVVFGDDLKKYLGEGTFVIEGKINNYPELQDEWTISIWVDSYITQNCVDVPVKKDGTFQAEIPIKDIQNVSVTIKEVIEFFAFKNDTIKIEFQHDKPLETLHLSGTSKNRNLDLELCLALSKYRRGSNSGFYLQDMMFNPSFTDSVRKEKLNQFYKEQIEIIDAFQGKNGDTEFSGKIRKDIYYLTCQYAIYRGMSFLPYINKYIDKQNYNQFGDFDFDFDYNLLDENMFRTSSGYRHYLSSYIYWGGRPLNRYITDVEGLESHEIIEKMTNKINKLKREYYYALSQVDNEPIRDWYITQQAYDEILESKPDDIRSFLDDFKTICQNETYISALENRYSAVLNLFYAASAPDFTLKNEKGELVSLSDFKGRIVYLDFWSPYCGPCIYEFLNSDKKFHEKYKPYDIVHIYVCFENDEKRWKENIKKYDLQGINLITEERKDNPIYINYMFHGWPYYILISKNGKVYKTDCERPSLILMMEDNSLNNLIKIDI